MGKKSRKKKQRRDGIIPSQDISPNKASGRQSSLALFLLRIVQWGSYAALFAPVVISSEFFFPFIIPKTIFFWMVAEIIFAAWVVLAISDKRFRPRWNFVSVAFLAFFAVSVFTAFTGVNPDRSFWSTIERMSGVVNWAHLVAYFIVITSVFKTQNDWKKLLSFSLIAAAVVSGIFLLEKAGFSVIPFDDRKGSTMGNSSFMGAYLLFNVFFGLWVLMKEKRENLKMAYGAASGISVVALLWSYAYGAIISMFGGLGIVMIAWLYFGSKIKFSKQIAIGVFLIGLTVAGGVGWGTIAGDKRILSKLPEIFSEGAAISARKVIWNIGWESFKDKPILGWGMENFNVAFTKNFDPCLPLFECGNEIWFDRTHNIILDQMVNSGILGLASYMAILIGAVFFLWRYFRRGPRDWLTPAVAIAVIASYFIQNLLVFDNISTYLMFVLVIGLCASSFVAGKGSDRNEKSVESLGPISPPKPFAFVVSSALLVCFLFFLGIRSLQAAHWGIMAIEAPMEFDQRMSLYKKTLNANPVGGRQVTEYFTNEIIKKMSLGEKIPLDFIKEVEREMLITSQGDPLNYRQRLIVGNFYLEAAKYDAGYSGKAEKYFEEAIVMSPENQQGYISLFNVYMKKKEYDKAVAVMEEAIMLEPRFFEPYLYLMDVYMISGNYAAGRDEFEKALSLGYKPQTVFQFASAAEIYEHVGSYSRAIFWYSQILSLEPDNPKHHAILSELHRRNGDEAEAERFAEQAKKLETNN